MTKKQHQVKAVRTDAVELNDAALDGVSGGAHPDLYRNIWINGTEIPAASREAGGTLN